jgi:hypothetical protein
MEQVDEQFIAVALALIIRGSRRISPRVDPSAFAQNFPP